MGNVTLFAGGMPQTPAKSVVMERGREVFRIVFAVTESGLDSVAGDTFTAIELGAVLQQRYGWQVEYRPEGNRWYDLNGVDVVIAMRDDYDPRRVVGAGKRLLKVAWARNWFERWCGRPAIQDFDLVFASSKKASRWMSARLGRLVHLLRIATNPRRFHHENRASTPDFDFVFSGSYWGAERDIVGALKGLEGSFRGAVFGRHWEKVPELQGLCRGFVPYEDLPGVYRRSIVVIDDANHVTREWGAANSRVFDALSAGCLVVTNSTSVSDEVFEGELPVYRNPEELRCILGRYLTDAPQRVALVDRLGRRVRQEHAYLQRAIAFRYLITRKMM